MVQNQCATTARRKLIFTALEPNYKVRKQNETMQHDTYELYMRRGWIPCDFSTPPSSEVSYASIAEVGTQIPHDSMVALAISLTCN